MMIDQTKKTLQTGFTLIEILVVMTIIGILVTLSVGSFQTSQIKSRDARRKSDLKQISTALEAYYNDKGQYPASSVSNQVNGCANESTCAWGDIFEDENGTRYMVELPADPRSNKTYYYYSDGTLFQIYARLENTLDPEVPVDVSDDPQNYGVSCGNGNCNFGVASSNTAAATGRTLTTE